MKDRLELYFSRDTEWYDWLHNNHMNHEQGVHLIFYKLEANIPTMRWEEAVKVALCFGWIDSTVKSLGDGKRRQYFCPRNPKSTWSKLNKTYIEELKFKGLIHESGWKLINLAKETGTWSEMDAVENLVVPKDLQNAFAENPIAFKNYESFSPSYRKGYLSWLHSGKRQTTRDKRIAKIIQLCEQNRKSRM